MPRRSLIAGGGVVAGTGSLLLALGLGLGGGTVQGAVAAPTPMSVGADGSWADGPGVPRAWRAPLVAGEPARTPSASGSVGQREPAPRPSDHASSTPRVGSGVNLSVTTIGLDVPVQPGGVSSSGRVVPPAGRAMWVRGHGRVAPGDMGTAVVAGHVASLGDDDVFADLSSIRVGHTVVITSGSVSRSYVVKRASVVTKSALTRDADVWGPNDVGRRVVLITCDDDLGFRSDGHRVANFVVVADAT
ncbi:class F sortase [Knoellia locipacati]|uniref:class F sortase n=1 Tax=Knoellia locipacati TaxID=882824 RepID=UPI00384A8A84